MSVSPEELVTTVQELSLTDTAKFHLICSDGERVAIDPELLASHSTVWRDTLDIGSSEHREGECAVSETSRQIRMFVLALSGQEDLRRDGDAEPMSTLLRLSDKYDSPLAKEIALRLMRERMDESPLLVFAVAAAHDDWTLAQQAAESTLRPEFDDWQEQTSLCAEYQQLDEAIKGRLTRYRSMHRDLAKECMQSSTSINAGSKHPICDYHDGALKAAWEKSIRLCSSRAKPHTIPREALEEALEKGRAGRDWCRSCRGRLTWKLGQIHHEWKEGKWFIKL